MGGKTKEELLKEIKRLTRKNSSLQKKIEKFSIQKNLAELEENCKAIFENAGFGIVLLNPDGKLLKVNSTLLKMLGYTKEEFSKVTVKDITHPHDFKTDLKLFRELATGRRNQYQIEKRYITKEGKIVYGKLTASRTTDKKGKKKNIIALVEDITEQKQIAGELASEQNLLIALLENSPDSIYFKDLNSRFIKVNAATVKKLGFSKAEQLIGKTDSDIFGPDHSTGAYNDEQEIIKTGTPIINKEEREDWPDGRTTWASTSKMPLHDSKGNIIGTFGITRDITDKKLVQERIRESEQVYRSLFENSVDGMFLMTDVFLDCNQAVCDLFKCKHSDIIAHSPVDFSPEVQPDGKNSFTSAKEKIEAALNGKPQRFYWQHKTKDNVLFDAEVSLNSVTIGGSKLIQAVVRDITERKKSERIREALFEISEAAYTASDMFTLYKRIHEVISTLMSTKNIYIALYNEKTDTISFPYFVDEYDPPQPPKKPGKGLTEYVLRLGEAVLIDAEKDMQLRRAGEVELIGAPQAIWLGVPLKLGGKTIGVIVVQDYENEKAYGEDEMLLLNFVSEQVAQVIERKRNSESIKKYAEELKQLNTTKDRFFSIIAHDLKNPFITLLGFSDLLISDYSELSDEEKIYYITEMKKSAEVSHNLLQNLLQWSRSQTGRIEFNPQRLNLYHLVKENIELLKAPAERKKIEIKCEISDATYVSADEDMLNTIVRNLLTNALKFTNKGGEIIVSGREKNNFFELSVSDNGVGMNEKARDCLFKLDVSHSSFGTDNEAGTGLGLILCKEFVEKHGGNIWVESELGKGSKFIFSVPFSV